MCEEAQSGPDLSPRRAPLRLGAWVDAVRSMSLGQIAARIGRRSRQRFIYPWAAETLYPQPAHLSEFPKPGWWSAFGEEHAEGPGELAEPAEIIGRADDFAEGRFTFLNLSSEPMSVSALWDDPPQSNRLWHETLHYGEWALVLARAFAATCDEKYRRALTELIQSWLDANSVGRMPAWSPYTIARRLVYWTRLAFVLGADTEWSRFFRERVEPSLRRQASFLADNLEHDVPNNHLLADYRALAWVGLSFPHWPEAEQLRRRGLGGLWREMRRQVLPDGVHFERSISYHTQVFSDLLETWHLARTAGAEVPEDIQPTLVKMLEFLIATRAPDGTWPMVNDSVPGYPSNPTDLIEAGAGLLGGHHPKPLPHVFRDAGYVVLRDDSDGCLFFDAGPMGPVEVPGHGHADALSFVLHGGGRPLIVDPGVFTYEDDVWRDHFRSTGVHNTISVDGLDQCDFWGAFRVAHQPRVHLVEWSDDHAIGAHDGYARLARPVTHRRTVKHLNRANWEIQDRLEGRGEHDFTLTLQFAPGAKAEAHDKGCMVRWGDGLQLSVALPSCPSGALARVQSGWVSSDWNIKERAHRFHLSWRDSLPSNVRLNLELILGRALRVQPKISSLFLASRRPSGKA
jgi:uncharacterized heparinase superfamily protein